MIARVFTHGGRAHADDFLACGLILYKYPEAVVYRVSKLPELGEGDVAVDIGGVYQPGRILDHHHDLELPSSFVLVLRDFYGYSYDELPRSFIHLDLRDRYGPRRVSEGNLLPSFVEEAVLAAFSKHSEIHPNSCIHQLLSSMGEAAVNRIEQLRFVRANAVYRLFHDGVYVAFSPKPAPVELLKEATPSDGVLVGVVMPDSRDAERRTALIRVDDSPWFNPSAIPVEKSFVHKTGFYVVADIPFEKVTPELVSKCVVA